MLDTVEMKVKGFIQQCQTQDLNTQPSYLRHTTWVATAPWQQDCKLVVQVVAAQWLKCYVAGKVAMCSSPSPAGYLSRTLL